MATVPITSDDGKLDSASSVLEVSATNPEYNQPALRIKQAGKRGGAASIRVDDPNPDIEFGRFEEGLNTAGLVIDSDKVFSKIGLLPSRLASLIFYKRHPERHQRPLNDGDPGIAEWPKICDDIVRPQLFRKFRAEDDCRFLPDDQQLGLPIAA